MLRCYITLLRGGIGLWLLGLPLYAFSQQPLPFVLCYEDKALPPYFSGEGKETPQYKPGVSIEILQRLNQQHPDINLTFRREPWKRCLAMLHSGDIDGVIASYKKSRLNIGTYPMTDGKPDEERAFEMTRYCLYTQADSALQWDGNAFHTSPTLPVAVPLGYSISTIFQQHNIEITHVNSTNRGFFLLANRRVSATSTLCEAGSQIIASNRDYSTIIEHDVPLRTKASYLMLSHQFYNRHPAISQQLWRSLVVINKQYYNQIYQRYSPP